MSEGLSELQAMEAAYSALQQLEPSAKRRAVQWLLDALGAPGAQQMPSNVVVSDRGSHNATNPQDTQGGHSSPEVNNSRSAPESDLTPKQFIAQKRPNTIAERIACLAFYLTHYRHTPKFRLSDIESLNTEAACTTINTSRDVDNARRRGYLVPAGEGKKQTTSLCEDFVNALPDRAAAKESISGHSSPRKRRQSNSKKQEVADGSDE